MSNLDEVIATFDWSTIRSFSDRSEEIPELMRALERGESDFSAAGRRLETTILSDGCLSEACLPVTVCLVASLPSATLSGRAAQALDVLAQIAAADSDGPRHEQIGVVDAQACRHAVASGFDLYCDILKSKSSYDEKLVCVDLISMCGYCEVKLRSKALSVLKLARSWPEFQLAASLIDSSLADVLSSRQ